MAAEDYIDEYPPFDDLDEDPPYSGTGSRQVSNNLAYYRTEAKPRRIKVQEPVIPGTVELVTLQAGETFRFPNAYTPANVYMVILSQDLEMATGGEMVHTVLLNSGKVYKHRPNKRVFQVDVRMTVDTAAGSVRV